MAVRCTVCPNSCLVAEGALGHCQVRTNVAGEVVDTQYGRVIVAQAEPVSKKPLLDFLPGSWTYSFGLGGCNLSCDYCRNNQISRGGRLGLTPARMAPAQIVAQAVRAGLPSVCATFTEPGIHREYVAEVFRLARASGLATIMVTNGYWSPETLAMLAPLTHAVCLSVKGDDPFYRAACGATLEPVLASAGHFVRSGCHIEVITPLVTGRNDSPAQLGAIASWIAATLGRDTRWHLSALYPTDRAMDWRLTEPASFVRALEAGRDHGLTRLRCEDVGEAVQAAWQAEVALAGYRDRDAAPAAAAAV